MGGESIEPKCDSNRRTNSVAFFRGFLREPQQVGSVIPSSRFLERRILEASELSSAKLVVELGPGTGGTTRTFLHNLSQTARLLSIELSPHFYKLLHQIKDPHFINHLGGAEDLTAILASHQLGRPDVIISGIPFSSMPKTLANRVGQAVADNLAEGGRFIAYQFRGEVARVIDPIMGPSASCTLEVRNIPPMRVYCWRKASNG